MNDEIVKLLAARIYLTDELPDWAIKCLEKGFDSKSLRMLASMSKLDSASELDYYFERSLKELNWDKISEKDYLMRYAEILAEEIINNKSEPIENASKIYGILKYLDYPARLHGFIEIDAMIWDYIDFLETHREGYFYLPKEELIGEIKRISEELIKSKGV